MYDPSSPFVRGSLPLQPRQMNDFAEERLRVAILWCELEPGETVTEAEIAERFGVGRAAARAALERLGDALGLSPVLRPSAWFRRFHVTVGASKRYRGR